MSYGSSETEKGIDCYRKAAPNPAARSLTQTGTVDGPPARATTASRAPCLKEMPTPGGGYLPPVRLRFDRGIDHAYGYV